MKKETPHILNEHFWFAATTIGVNAFILKEKGISLKSIDSVTLIIISSFLSFYGIYLVLHRSAAHSNKLIIPKSVEGIEEKDKTFVHKFVETLCHIRVVIQHIPFVVTEFSGSLFYILLIILSYFGVLCTQ